MLTRSSSRSPSMVCFLFGLFFISMVLQAPRAHGLRTSALQAAAEQTASTQVEKRLPAIPEAFDEKGTYEGLLPWALRWLASARPPGRGASPTDAISLQALLNSHHTAMILLSLTICTILGLMAATVCSTRNNKKLGDCFRLPNDRGSLLSKDIIPPELTKPSWPVVYQGKREQLSPELLERAREAEAIAQSRIKKLIEEASRVRCDVAAPLSSSSSAEASPVLEEGHRPFAELMGDEGSPWNPQDERPFSLLFGKEVSTLSSTQAVSESERIAASIAIRSLPVPTAQDFLGLQGV